MVINEIELLYKEIKHKSDFIARASTLFKKEYNTLKNHWFSKFGGWSVPKEHKDECVKLMRDTIKKQ